MGLQADVIAMLNENMPQEALEGASDGLTEHFGVPAPHTLDGALYEAYRAGWSDSQRQGIFVRAGASGHHLMRQSFNAWRRRFVTLPEADDE